MLLTEAVIYLLVFTKRRKATLAKHIFPVYYIWFVPFGGGEEGVSLAWVV